MIKREHLKSLPKQLVSELQPLIVGDIKEVEIKYPGLPKVYLKFLEEYGPGKIREIGVPERFPAHIEYLKALESAEKSYYNDMRIYENVAVGDILIFGVESNGVTYGFDTGDGYSLVQVDNYRVVKKLMLNFEEFFFGVLACFPDFPERFESNMWLNDINDKFDIHSIVAE